jgi:hypothetical protein
MPKSEKKQEYHRRQIPAQRQTFDTTTKPLAHDMNL